LKVVLLKNKYYLNMVACRIFLLLLFVSLTSFAEAQVNRYVVFFKDKNNSSFSTAAPQLFLSQRAINRRIKNQVEVTTQDLPVNATYVSEVKQTGALTFYTSRWFNALLIQCDAALLPTIEALPSVDNVELVAPGILNSNAATNNAAYLSARISSTKEIKTTSQLNMLGLDAMHELNIRGEGVKVAVFDSGFPGVNTVAPFSHLVDNIKDTYNFVNRQTNVYRNDDHGTEVLSVMAAFIENSFIGGTYNADYHLYLTEDVGSEYRIEEYNWLFAAERADSAGVDVINASLGYNTFDNAAMNYTKLQLDGNTAVVTRAAQLASDRGIVVVVSAGNEGNNSWQLVTPPADAVGVIAVGSVTSTEIKSGFSSIGPTSDNRIKPDLCAMGSGTFVVRNTGNTGTTSGTSVASPLMASLVTGIIQRYDTLTKDEIVEVLKASASLAESPNNQLGYGVPNFAEVRLRLEIVAGLENPESTRFAVYPNPADSGFVMIETVQAIQAQPLQVEVWDMKGSLLKQIDGSNLLSKGRLRMDMTEFPAGLLQVRINHAGQTDIFKIINVR
jgi:serine protease AprX